jgi:hypothetical protein
MGYDMMPIEQVGRHQWNRLRDKGGDVRLLGDESLEEAGQRCPVLGRKRTG